MIYILMMVMLCVCLICSIVCTPYIPQLGVSDTPGDVPRDVPSNVPHVVPSNVPRDVPRDVSRDLPHNISNIYASGYMPVSKDEKRDVRIHVFKKTHPDCGYIPNEDAACCRPKRKRNTVPTYHIQTDIYDMPVGPIFSCASYLPVPCSQQTKDYYRIKNIGKGNFKLKCYKLM